MSATNAYLRAGAALIRVFTPNAALMLDVRVVTRECCTHRRHRLGAALGVVSSLVSRDLLT